MPTSRLRVIGALLLIIGAIGFVSAEAVTANQWTDPKYSYRFDYISDLGNPVPHDFVFEHTVNSPRHVVMNFGFVTQGILFAIATVLLYRLFRGRSRLVILGCGITHGIGMLLAGVFHQQSVNAVEMAIHWVGAYGIIFGPIGVALVGVLGRRAGASAWYRAMSAVLGFGGVLAGLALLYIPAVRTITGGGTLERIAMYGLFIWQVVTGVSLLIRAGRPSINGSCRSSRYEASGRLASGVGVGAGRRDQHGRAPLFAHHPVVGVPVVVGSTGRGEDVAEHNPESLVIDVRVRVIGSDQLRRTFDGGPLPTRARCDCATRVGTKVGQLAGAPDGHQSDDLLVRQRVLHDPGVDDR